MHSERLHASMQYLHYLICNTFYVSDIFFVWLHPAPVLNYVKFNYIVKSRTYMLRTILCLHSLLVYVVSYPYVWNSNFMTLFTNQQSSACHRQITMHRPMKRSCNLFPDTLSPENRPVLTTLYFQGPENRSTLTHMTPGNTEVYW